MKKFIILMPMITIAMGLFISCNNSTSLSKAEKARIERELFVRDSIARVKFVQDSINTAKHNAEIIKKYESFFDIKKDEFSNNSWVKPKSAPKYTNQNGVYCYFTMENGKVTSNFRFRYQYYADEWLFIKNMIFNIDGENITIVPDMDTDCGYGGKIWEWCDELVYGTSGISEEFIKKIANATSVKIKMNGSHYYDTRTLSASQIKSIKNTYEYFLALGGTFYN